MSSAVFQKLDELVECANRVPILEKKWKEAVARDSANAERNILQCPPESLSEMHALRSEFRQMLEEAPKVVHAVKKSTRATERLLADADKIMDYIERETARAENYLKPHGFHPWGENRSSFVGRKSDHPDNDVKTEMHSHASVDSAFDFKDSTSRSINQDNPDKLKKVQMKMPETPKLPDLKTHNRSKSDSLCTPRDPLLETTKSFKMTDSTATPKEINQLRMCEALSLESPKLVLRQPKISTVDTPEYHGFYFPKNLKTGDCIATKGRAAPLFAPVQNSPELKMHTRRSCLTQTPPTFDNGEEDDTVYRLFSHRPVPKPILSPQSPELMDRNNQKSERGERNLGMPATPVSPELNLPRGQLSEQSFCEITVNQYDSLPLYVKRLLPFDSVNGYLRSVVSTSTAAHGGKYSRVTTEDEIARATALGGKTKSFIYALKFLGVVKEIRGTSFYEILL